MTKNFLFRCLIVASLGLVIPSLSWGVDVNGPYKNGQTSIEYILTGDNTVTLYGIDCRNNPTDANGYMLYNTVEPGQSIWTTNQFLSTNGGQLTGSYPTLLSRNNAVDLQNPNERYCVSMITPDNHAYLALRSNPFQFTSISHSDVTTDEPTRVATRFQNWETQWSGLKMQIIESNPAMKTTDGWQNAFMGDFNPRVPWGSPASTVYSLCIEDQDQPGQAMMVLTWSAAASHLVINARSVISDQDEHPGVFFTNSQGEEWNTLPEYQTLWIQNENVQLAMVRCYVGTSGQNLAYVVSGSGVNISCIWASILGNGEFTWHQAFPSGLPDIEGYLPIRPMDLEAVVLDATTVRLVMVTTRGVYVCDHHPATEDRLEWQNADPNGTISTENLWDVSLDPTSPADHFAVAGQAGCFVTTDAGVQWEPILNAGQFQTYASGGVRQSNTCIVAAYVEQTPLYCEHEFGDPVKNLYGVYVQTGPRQEGAFPSGRLTSVHQLGYSKARDCGPCGLPESCEIVPGYRPSDTPGDVPRMDYSALDGRFYVAYADAFIGEGICDGLVSFSTDDGETWNVSHWPNCAFQTQFGQCHHAPIPSTLVASSCTPLRAYITFGQILWESAVPPFALTEDGGQNWIAPANSGLHPEQWPTPFRPNYFVASGRVTGSNSELIWLVGNPGDFDWAESRLWYSANEGTEWNPVDLPPAPTPPPFWGAATGVACRPEGAERVAVYGPDGIGFYRLDDPQSWRLTTRPVLPDGRIESVVADRNLEGLWWVAVYNDQAMARKGFAVIAQGTEAPRWVSVADEWIANGEEVWGKSDLWLDSNEDNVSRLFWSLSVLPDLNGRSLSTQPTVKYFEYPIIPPSITEPTTIVNSPVYMFTSVTVEEGASLTIEPGVTVLCAPGAKLIVEGTLRAEGALGEEITFGKVAEDQSGPWEGIYVEGRCDLSYCTIEGAVTGLKSVKGADLVLTSCVIQNNETGLDLYAPGGTGNPEINGCTVVDNQGRGIVLTGTESATILECQINHNGDDGVLLIDSYAELTENQIRENGGYGLECLGSSPVLYCNNFQNNGAGEMGLFKESYPVLWYGAHGVGANSFMNDTQTLITMESSAPLVVKGWNDFYVGPIGFFMADLSEKPVEHDLSGNYWSPHLRLELLYPPDPKVWKWYGVAESPSNCGTPKGELMGLAGLLFEEGLEAEMSGDLALAHTKYAQLVTLYPDSAWSLPAAARLFETQRHLDSAYTTLQAFYDTVASNHPEDTLLANAARALATRLWVEDGQYDPALFAYQQVIQNPPSSMDSVYAALDYSVTALRAQIEDSGGHLDSYSPSVSAASIGRLVRLVRTTLPTVPPTLHEGYSLPPSNFVLAQNYPNPFNALTTIRYYLPEASRVTLDVYNITGQHVATLTDGLESSGYHVVHWNASSVASGVYVYQIKAGDFVDSKKMVLIR
jgi:parallel beta-helix repeat protein